MFKRVDYLLAIAWLLFLGFIGPFLVSAKSWGLVIFGVLIFIALCAVTVKRFKQDSYFECGKIYLIRTVTMIDTGRVVAVNQHEIVLEDAAWIADTGRFSDAIKKASFNEVEPFPDGRVILGRGAIIDAVRISSAQRSQK